MRMITLLGLLLFLPINIAAQQSNLSFRSRYINTSKTSAVILDLNTGELLSTLNPNMELNPASLTKIPTAYSALKILGPAHRIATTFCSNKPDQDGALSTLYVVGNGNPMLSEEDYWKIAGDIKARGIKSIENIIVDNSFFDNGHFPNPNNNHDSDRAFLADTSAVPVNFNSIAITVLPNKKVFLRPDLPALNIQNKLGKGRKFSVKCYGDTLPQTCVIKGRKPKKVKTIYRKLADPPLTAGLMFANYLTKRGVDVSGNVSKGKSPQYCKPILINYSPPVSNIVKAMMTYSSNFIAEQLVKYIGATKYGPPGTTRKGIRAIKTELKNIGVIGEVMENGSGLSLNNRFSAEQIAKILRSAWADFSIGPEFYTALARDDDLNSTLDYWDFPVHLTPLRGKTGTLSSVSALAGYLPDKAFVLITNQPPKGPHKARAGLVKLLNRLVENSYEKK